MGTSAEESHMQQTQKERHSDTETSHTQVLRQLAATHTQGVSVQYHDLSVNESQLAVSTNEGYACDNGIHAGSGKDRLD